MTKIIGFSGKKCSGKDTSANFILGTIMVKLNYITSFKITPLGKLYCCGWANGLSEDGLIDYDENTQFIRALKKNCLDKHIKLYSFADCLKKEICIKMLGLTHQQCYGSNEEKNQLTHLRWEDMPGVFTQFWSAKDNRDFQEQVGPNSKFYRMYEELVVHSPGFMTSREVMQFVGTNVMRRMYGDCHVNATIEQIKEDNPEIAIIRDTRFINEVEGINKNDGIVFRFLRNPNKDADAHESEIALDNYPMDNFYAVIDNREMSITEQNIEVTNILNTKRWL